MGVEDLNLFAEDHPLAKRVWRALAPSTPALGAPLPLKGALVALYKAGDPLRRFLRQLLVLTARAFDTFLPGKGLPQDPLAVVIRTRPRKRRDPNLAEALTARYGRKSPGTSEVASRALGFRGRWLASSEKKKLVQYFLASRRHFSKCRHFCVSLQGGQGARNQAPRQA